MICGKCDEDKHPMHFQPKERNRPPHCKRTCTKCKQPARKHTFAERTSTWRFSHQKFFTKVVPPLKFS